MFYQENITDENRQNMLKMLGCKTTKEAMSLLNAHPSEQTKYEFYIENTELLRKMGLHYVISDKLEHQLQKMQTT
ncbi:hypothetical protein [Sulfuricurvum sp.]|uniref:hypothetical protein n=1 Tax=Sulfuricurvum sp. TaxID=2025608 RepID=UPI00262BE707|nr:hypothetical protein [Sulfuricurvum sp.]MDD2266999.1 hypothetical protein [Sulfuricurvum sp.]MDD2782615.1 hypothetical protein [Sulfuricurvum sp.]